jgi:ring-1,2-phenylacetyl-CoA epoxidase subunit PaaE
MASSFHTIRIKEIKKETSECVSIVFDIPEELSSLFLFSEGQNITIKKEIDGQEVRRSYSICNAPYEKEVKVAVKKIEGGLFSTFANDVLSVHDSLELLPPTGKFSAHFSSSEYPSYLAIAAGSGITPIISIIKHTLYTQPNSKFTLIYGSKNRPSIIFFEELESIKNKYMDRFTFINVLSREKMDAEIFYGRIGEEKLSQLGKLIDYRTFDSAYLCGPSSMIFSAAAFLENVGIQKSNIHYELFTTPGPIKTQLNTESKPSVQHSSKSNVTIKLDGRTFSFELSNKGHNILDAALQEGADLPYACKGGVCCTCRAKLVEGEVTMDVNYALEEDEIKNGFILTCQSHPVTEQVVIDFDIK